MAISIRKAFQMAVKHSLQNMQEERKIELNNDVDDLAFLIIDSYEFSEDFEQMLMDHIQVYGSNYNIE